MDPSAVTQSGRLLESPQPHEHLSPDVYRGGIGGPHRERRGPEMGPRHHGLLQPGAPFLRQSQATGNSLLSNRHPRSWCRETQTATSISGREAEAQAGTTESHIKLCTAMRILSPSSLQSPNERFSVPCVLPALLPCCVPKTDVPESICQAPCPLAANWLQRGKTGKVGRALRAPGLWRNWKRRKRKP